MSNRWFRFYDGALDDPKIIKLPDDLYRAWVSLLCAASKNDGHLPPLDDVAIMLRMSVSQVEKIVSDLIERELLDRCRGGIVEPHNWRKRQYKSDVSTDRVKQFRKRQRNVSETPPETETETETETEQKDSSLRSLGPQDWPSDFREAFWKLYPLKVGKKGAIRELERVRKLVSWQKLIDGLRAYAATADPKFTKHPQTWLSKGCWDDELPKSSMGTPGTAETITPQSPSWNIWKAHYRDTGQNFKAGHMDKSASDGKAFTVPSEYPPGYKKDAA